MQNVKINQRPILRKILSGWSKKQIYSAKFTGEKSEVNTEHNLKNSYFEKFILPAAFNFIQNGLCLAELFLQIVWYF